MGNRGSKTDLSVEDSEKKSGVVRSNLNVLIMANARCRRKSMVELEPIPTHIEVNCYSATLRVTQPNPETDMLDQAK